MRIIVPALVCSFMIASPAGGAAERASEPPSARQLIGVWGAHKSYGPEVRGLLSIHRRAGRWSARIAGHSAEVRVEGDAITFSIPGDRGSFRGRIDQDGARIRGHWIQPGTRMMGSSFASPVLLARTDPDRWSGSVLPLEDEMTLYLVIRAQGDGVRAFLRNPERNAGVFRRIEDVERDGNRIRFLGGAQGSDQPVDRVEATYIESDGRLVVDFGSPYGTFDLVRIDDDPASPFHPRGPGGALYEYEPPPAANDGWKTGSLEQAGMAPGPIRELMRRVIDTPTDSVHAPYLHALLAARHGVLVLEEYFHGYHRDKPHDSRSASKSLTSTLIGIAIRNGDPNGVSDPVYAVINGGRFPEDLEPRRRALQVRHLLTMTSGFDCDDNDATTPGNEDVMQSQQDEPDWVRYTLNLPMKRDPGEKAVYCSAGSNLLGGVLRRATGRWLPEYFAEMIAGPLQIERYYINLMPTGEAYGGGGIYWLPRDFLKLGQLMLDGGTWNGTRLLDEDWVRDATTAHEQLNDQGYGYSWWIISYPYKDRTVKALYAGGNGGQMVIVVPELDLAVLTFAGSYGHFPSLLQIRDDLVGYIIRSIEQGGT